MKKIKKKNKGFTLVEILSVVAILVVLMVVVMPNFIESFKGSKKNNFMSEAQNVYKAANNQYVLDRAKGFYEITYQKGINDSPGTDVKELDVSSRDGFAYMVTFNSNGEITYFLVQDYENKIEVSDPGGGVKPSDIIPGEVTTEPTPIKPVEPVLCDPGYYFDSSAKGCHECPIGYYCTGGESDKTKCPTNTISPKGAKSVDECVELSDPTPITPTTPEDPTPALKECPAGKYRDSETNKCVSCPEGTTSEAGATSIKQCEPTSSTPITPVNFIDFTVTRTKSYNDSSRYTKSAYDLNVVSDNIYVTVIAHRIVFNSSVKVTSVVKEKDEYIVNAVIVNNFTNEISAASIDYETTIRFTGKTGNVRVYLEGVELERSQELSAS